MNNHEKTILFGCAILRNETTSTFKWLMKTFVSIMKKSPKTIITDQDPWMTQAIATEMSTTKHSFCIWHITSKFSC
ncbi:FAR1-related sequence 11 [Hibiscus trionum]|uniref:Protein FAR1-RELATED SEQUENCE n=1 Tax=Hibiscus trionum TaxID=183268 RepID=A0A9W7GVT6_HIBTR|nr:FAR1-related sequence 11 [Hibiscus trionum]